MNPRPPFLSRAWRHLRWRWWDGPRGRGRPAAAAVFDAEYAGGHWDHFHDGTEAPRYARLAALVAAGGRPLRLLDVACGSGRLAATVAPKSVSDYLGIDISAEGLARARALALPWARFQLGDFETWRPPDAWDLIVFNECVGYMRDPATTLVSWGDSLTPGGTMLVSYFRSGNHRAIWRRVKSMTTVLHEEALVGPGGHVWDICVLKPRP